MHRQKGEAQVHCFFFFTVCIGTDVKAEVNKKATVVEALTGKASELFMSL